MAEVPIRDLALGRAADLAPPGSQAGGGSDYDASVVEAEVTHAARRVVERVFDLHGPLALVQPRQADTAPSLVRGADLGALRAVVVAADTYAADRTAGFLFVEAPADLLRLVRVQVSGWRGACLVLGSAEAGPDARLDLTAVPGSSRPGGLDGPTLDVPRAYLSWRSFAASETKAASVEPALALTPIPAGLSGTTGAAVLAELLYVPVPDPDALTGGMLDAAAWFTAAALLSQDPETERMSQRAEQQGERALQDLAPRHASITYRAPRALV